jgi:hypothetical protein
MQFDPAFISNVWFTFFQKNEMDSILFLFM